MSFRENLWRTDLSHVELREPLTISPGTSIHQSIELMRRHGTGCVLVCEGGALVGIFTERDFIKRVLVPLVNLDQPVSTVMTRCPVTVRLRDSVGLAIRTMNSGGYRRLPVINERGIPIGLISVKRIIRYLADHFPTTVYNLPPQPRQVQQAREGA